MLRFFLFLNTIDKKYKNIIINLNIFINKKIENMKKFIIIFLSIFLIYALTQTVSAQANPWHSAVKNKNGKDRNHRKAISFSQKAESKNQSAGPIGFVGRFNKSTRSSIKVSPGGTACASSSKKPENKNSTGPIGYVGRNKSNSNSSVK